MKRRYEIHVEGKDEHAFDSALAEAMRRIKAGNLAGHDENEDSSFRFSSATNEHTQD
ncbi:hypothetical protein [Cupriavidus sp. RAF12]|uniref:hypothetical protein n=1 Tax=Cupriavidus sp. RAF12 TaxID=3233050 RepID=UPI003F933990